MGERRKEPLSATHTHIQLFFFFSPLPSVSRLHAQRIFWTWKLSLERKDLSRFSTLIARYSSGTHGWRATIPGKAQSFARSGLSILLLLYLLLLLLFLSPSFSSFDSKVQYSLWNQIQFNSIQLFPPLSRLLSRQNRIAAQDAKQQEDGLCGGEKKAGRLSKWLRRTRIQTPQKERKKEGIKEKAMSKVEAKQSKTKQKKNGKEWKPSSRGAFYTLAQRHAEEPRGKVNVCVYKYRERERVSSIQNRHPVAHRLTSRAYRTCSVSAEAFVAQWAESSKQPKRTRAREGETNKERKQKPKKK